MRKVLISIMIILGISQSCELLTYPELDHLRESSLLHPRNGLKCENGYYYSGLADEMSVIGAKVPKVMTYCACMDTKNNRKKFLIEIPNRKNVLSVIEYDEYGFAISSNKDQQVSMSCTDLYVKCKREIQ